MTSDTRYHHGNLKQTLIDHALEIIHRDGVDQLSLRKLATGIGVNQTALYSHFKNKNELLAELARQGYVELTERLQQLAQNESTHDNIITALAERYISFARTHPEVFKLMFSPSFTQLHQNDETLWTTSQQSFHIYEQIITRYLQQKQANTSPKLAALAAWSFMHGFCHLIIGDRLSSDTLQTLNEGALLPGLVHLLENGIGH
ncbi:MAG: TetR/AcrR family transcriptional regulator [Oleiphilaceae bacterium]|nr:TetR/AcrR family transcriptional regulator [Oleiphilaceae bacterium]